MAWSICSVGFVTVLRAQIDHGHELDGLPDRVAPWVRLVASEPLRLQGFDPRHSVGRAIVDKAGT